METESAKVISSAAEHLGFLEIGIGLCVLVVINYLLKKGIKQVRKRSLSTTHDWRQKLDYILLLPINLMLWTLGGILILEVTGARFGFSLFDGYLNPFRATVVVCCIAWMLLRWKKELQFSFLEKDRRIKKVDTAFVQVLGKILSIITLLIAFMIILQLWGLNIGPLIAFGGIGAAAIGFAAKDMIANFFGGLMLHITRPFMPGDLILIPERNLEGHVEEIGWYSTSVRDKEKRPVYLPNALFSNVLVVNSSRMTHRRIEQKVGIRYEDYAKMSAIVEEIRSAIKAHPSIDTHLPVLVVFHALNQYAIDLYIDVYTLTTRYDEYLAVKHEILQLVYDAIVAQGAEVPYPVVQLKGAFQST